MLIRAGHVKGNPCASMRTGMPSSACLFCRMRRRIEDISLFVWWNDWILYWSCFYVLRLQKKTVYISGEITLSDCFVSLWKGVYFKTGSKFFPFRVVRFSEGVSLAGMQTRMHKKCLPLKWREIYKMYQITLTLILLNPGMSCLRKQCRSRSVGFWRSLLIYICTVCRSVCELISTIKIMESDWLTIRSGCGILIYSAGKWLIDDGRVTMKTDETPLTNGLFRLQ